MRRPGDRHDPSVQYQRGSKHLRRSNPDWMVGAYPTPERVTRERANAPGSRQRLGPGSRPTNPTRSPPQGSNAHRGARSDACASRAVVPLWCGPVQRAQQRNRSGSGFEPRSGEPRSRNPTLERRAPLPHRDPPGSRGGCRAVRRHPPEETASASSRPTHRRRHRSPRGRALVLVRAFGP